MLLVRITPSNVPESVRQVKVCSESIVKQNTCCLMDLLEAE